MPGQARFGDGRVGTPTAGPWPEPLTALRLLDGTLALPPEVEAIGDEAEDAGSDAVAAIADAATAQATADAAAAALASLPDSGAGRTTLEFTADIEVAVAVTGQTDLAADAGILCTLLAPTATEIAESFEGPFVHTVTAGVGFSIVLRTAGAFTGSPVVCWRWQNP